MPVENVRMLAEGIMADVTEDLAALVRIPSCAFPGFPSEPVMQTAEAVVDLLERYGIPGARLLDVPGGYPAVYAEIAAPPGAPTILLYAHYDIQPAPLEQGWDMDPFEPEIRDGRMYGRGAADDKSGVMIIATALRLFGGEPPVGIKVLMEGEEETGSNLETLIAANPDLVRCDAFVINDGGNMKAGEPELTAALRGIAACDVTVRSLKGMAHSGSYGGAAPDALMALIRILDNLLDEHGDVAIPGLTRFEWEGGGHPGGRLSGGGRRAAGGRSDGHRDARLAPLGQTVGDGHRAGCPADRGRLQQPHPRGESARLAAHRAGLGPRGVGATADGASSRLRALGCRSDHRAGAHRRRLHGQDGWPGFRRRAGGGGRGV